MQVDAFQNYDQYSIINFITKKCRKMTEVILCIPKQKNDVKKSLEKNGVKPQQKVKKFLDIRKSKNVFYESV